MIDFKLPDYINTFLSLFEDYLTDQKIEIRLDKNLLHNEQPSLIFDLIGLPYKTSLILHQTSESLNGDVPEFRARVGSTLSDDVAGVIQGEENMVNRYASLAAIVVSEKSVDVVCQTLIQEEDAWLSAYLLSLAAVYGALSITQSLRKGITNEKDEVQSISRWCDIDFEQIQYDNAHLVQGKLGHLQCRFERLHGDLELTATYAHPYFGGGLLSREIYTKKQLKLEGKPVSANELNQLTFLASDTPMFGAWCEVDEYFVFATFLPNFMKDVQNINDYLIHWFNQRNRDYYNHQF